MSTSILPLQLSFVNGFHLISNSPQPSFTKCCKIPICRLFQAVSSPLGPVENNTMPLSSTGIDIFTSLPLSVMANKAKPEQPLLYQQAGIIITFSKNWGSYLANHLLPVYQNYLLAGHTGT